MPSAGMAGCPQPAAVEAQDLRTRICVLNGNEFCEPLSFATPHHHASAPKVRPIVAQGCRASARLPWVNWRPTGKQIHRLLRALHPPAASATSLAQRVSPVHTSAISSVTPGGFWRRGKLLLPPHYFVFTPDFSSALVLSSTSLYTSSALVLRSVSSFSWVLR